MRNRRGAPLTAHTSGAKETRKLGGNAETFRPRGMGQEDFFYPAIVQAVTQGYGKQRRREQSAEYRVQIYFVLTMYR